MGTPLGRLSVVARKKRPVLYEVIRPEHHRGEPTPGVKPPSGPPPSLPLSPPRPVRPTAAPKPATPAPEEPVREGRTFTITFPMLAIIAACAAMLVFVAFVAGRQFETQSTGEAPKEYTLDMDGSGARPETRGPAPSIRESAAESASLNHDTTPQKTTDPEKESETERPPTIALQKGYTYVVIQHFQKTKRADAEAAAEFLRENRIPAALLVGNDIRLVATEPFLIEQRDAAAAERERRRAGQWLQTIKELGREYDKRLRELNKPSYTFSECYPTLMR